MTVDAAAGEQEGAWRSARQTLRRVGDGRMTRALVTGLAQKRCAHLEQRGLYRAVRLMAAGAVLGHRLVFPEKRPAVFGVTGRASLINGIFNQLRRGRGTVRRMARRARHRAFAQWVMRRLQKIAVLCLMTGGADFDLGGGRLYRILGRVQLMAACAGNIACGMGA